MVIDGRIEVNIDRIVQNNYKGFGVEWDPYCNYILTDSEWDLVKLRMDFLKPAFIRCGFLAYWYCRGFGVGGNPLYDFNSSLMQCLYKILDYCQDNGIKVLLCEWMAPAYTGRASASGLDALKTCNIVPDDARWSQIIAGMLEHLVKIMGYSCITGFNYINEPNGEWNHCSFEEWKTGVCYLKAELDKRGLSNLIKISGPDSLGAFDTWLVPAASGMSRVIGQYDAHWYATSVEIYNGIIEASLKKYLKIIHKNDPEEAKKALIIAEAGIIEPRAGVGDQQLHVKSFWYGVGITDYAVQAMRAGVSGISGWGLDDASWLNYGVNPYNEDFYEDPAGSMSSSYVTADCYPSIPTQNTLKVWGFWNSLGRRIPDSQDTDIRPWFYPWSLLSRLIPAGSKILGSNSIDKAGLRVAAARISRGCDYDITIVVVNNSDDTRSLAIKFKNITKKADFRQYNYFIDDRPIDANGFPIVKQILEGIDLSEGLDVILPTKGIAIYTTL